MKPIFRFLIGQAVLLLFLVTVPWLVIDKVPGLMKPTAAILCPADKPDAYIVEYYKDVGNGVGTSTTLVCMGPRGDIHEAGSWAPLGLTFGALVLAGEAVVLPLQLLGILRRRRQDQRPRPPGPPVPGPPPPVRGFSFGGGDTFNT